jgi:hypothetical protein
MDKEYLPSIERAKLEKEKDNDRSKRKDQQGTPGRVRGENGNERSD